MFTEARSESREQLHIHKTHAIVNRKCIMSDNAAYTQYLFIQVNFAATRTPQLDVPSHFKCLLSQFSPSSTPRQYHTFSANFPHTQLFNHINSNKECWNQKFRLSLALSGARKLPKWNVSSWGSSTLCLRLSLYMCIYPWACEVPFPAKLWHKKSAKWSLPKLNLGISAFTSTQ